MVALVTCWLADLRTGQLPTSPTGCFTAEAIFGDASSRCFPLTFNKRPAFVISGRVTGWDGASWRHTFGQQTRLIAGEILGQNLVNAE